MNRRTLLLAGIASLSLPACAAQNVENEMPESDADIAPGSNRDFSFTVATSNPDGIWELWRRPDTWAQWDLGLSSAVMEGDMALGSTGRIEPRSGRTSTFEVVAFNPKQSYAFETRLPGSVLRVERFFNADRTKFSHRVTFSGLTSGAFARMLGPGFRQALPPTMQRLKTLSEQEK